MGGSHGHSDDHDPHPPGPTVVAVSKVSPKVRTIAVSRPTTREVSYLEATIAGLGVTGRHFLRNFFGKLRPRDQRATGEAIKGGWIRPISDIQTYNYPEEKVPYPPRYRGLHRLMQRDDGAVRCVACMCCPTVCPAHCITIVPEESDDGSIEKRPAVFEIDELRCVVCGLCVEACPCDAIRMDSGVHAKPVERRGDAIMTRDLLLDLSKKVKKDPHSIATQGGAGPDWRDE